MGIATVHQMKLNPANAMQRLRPVASKPVEIGAVSGFPYSCDSRSVRGVADRTNAMSRLCNLRIFNPAPSTSRHGQKRRALQRIGVPWRVYPSHHHRRPPPRQSRSLRERAPDWLPVRRRNPRCRIPRLVVGRRDPPSVAGPRWSELAALICWYSAHPRSLGGWMARRGLLRRT